MRWLRDLSIKWKLTLVTWLTSLAVLLLVCGALVVYELVTFRTTMAQDMTVLADALGRNSTASLTFTEMTDITDASPDKAALDARETLSALAAEPHIIAAALYVREPKGKGQKRFADYVRAGAMPDFPDQPPADGYLFGSNYMELSHAIMFNGERIGTIYLRADLQGMWDRLKSYGLIVGAVVVLTLLMTSALSSGMQRLISRPILALTDTARIVAERKDYSVRAPGHGSDELGVLTNAINQMLSEIESRQNALQQANQSLQAQSSQITQTVGVLGASSRDILDLSTQVASGATETATAVTEATATVEEVRHTALLSSEKTRQVSENSQHVAQISLDGKKSTEEAVEGMNRIRAQMQSIAESMVRLSEQTQTIGGIIATVESLAQQSNLLAVNAAIEAAKAGEHGRGFAVVAQEVKNLAEQSRQATTQVRTILSDIQKATNAAAMATEQGTKAVEAGVKQSAQAGDSILTLAGSVAEAAQTATQIATSSQQQLVGMDQVAQAIESIKQATNRNVEIGRQLEAAARNLSTLGQRLRDLVGRCLPENMP